MSVAVLKDEHNAVWYCTTTLKAVSNVFAEPEKAEEFLERFDGDPRHYSAYEIDSMYYPWLDGQDDCE